MSTALIATATLPSPTGPLRVSASDTAIVRITWVDDSADESDAAGHPLLTRAADQLAAYFAGERQNFDLPVAPAGSEFQQRVWAEMTAIPWGETRTYGDLARTLEVMPQPIGQACGDNPIPVVIPCHRVVAADGKLGGFSGGRGVETKLALLRHEGAWLL